MHVCERVCVKCWSVCSHAGKMTDAASIACMPTEARAAGAGTTRAPAAAPLLASIRRCPPSRCRLLLGVAGKCRQQRGPTRAAGASCQVSAVSSLDAGTRCHTTRSRPPSLLVAWRGVNANQRSLSLARARATPFRNITPQRGGADTAADGAQWCPAGSCPPLQLSAACSDLAWGLG